MPPRSSTAPRSRRVLFAAASTAVKIFPPNQITEWVDADSTGEGQTALCPKCGIDSVIGEHATSALRAAWSFLAEPDGRPPTAEAWPWRRGASIRAGTAEELEPRAVNREPGSPGRW